MDVFLKTAKVEEPQQISDRGAVQHLDEPTSYVRFLPFSLSFLPERFAAFAFAIFAAFVASPGSLFASPLVGGLPFGTPILALPILMAFVKKNTFPFASFGLIAAIGIASFAIVSFAFALLVLMVLMVLMVRASARAHC